MRRIWSVLVLATLAACSDPAGPAHELALQLEEAQSIQETADVEAQPGAVVVRGVYVAPSSGYTLRADYRLTRGGGVIVTISGVAPAAGLAVISRLGYRATVPLPAGTHTVRVMHRDPGLASGDRRLVATQQVTVPAS